MAAVTEAPGDGQGMGLPPPMPSVPEPEAPSSRACAAQVVHLCACLTCSHVQVQKVHAHGQERMHCMMLIPSQ